MTLFRRYLFLSGVLVHLLVVLILLWQPSLIKKVTNKLSNKYYQFQAKREYKLLTQGKVMTLEQEISKAFVAWKPRAKNVDIQNKILVNKQPFEQLIPAIRSLQHGDTLVIPEGVYQTPIVIKKNDITIIGNGHVVFEKKAARGKGYILSQGNNLTVENIECRYINVSDGNGACIRQEGKDLTLNHVYFHSSQEGILETAKEIGFIKIFDSRFERLGFNGQAHGIYTNKAEVAIYQSLFVAAKSEGHAIKVRGKRLYIEASVIASLSSDDSRLIDMSNGGELIVKNSILEQGPKSTNGQMIGFGLEGIKHVKNQIQLVGNIIYLDRIGVNQMLKLPSKQQGISVIQEKNLIIGIDLSEEKISTNNYFKNREELGLPNYPHFSKSLCYNLLNCFIAD